MLSKSAIVVITKDEFCLILHDIFSPLTVKKELPAHPDYKYADSLCLFSLYQAASAAASPKYVKPLLFSLKFHFFRKIKVSSFFIYVLLLNHHKTT